MDLKIDIKDIYVMLFQKMKKVKMIVHYFIKILDNMVKKILN